MGKPAPNWQFSAARGGNTGPSLPPRSRKTSPSLQRGKAGPNLGSGRPRASVNRRSGTPPVRGSRGRPATAPSPHRALRGDKASQEGCRRFSRLQRSACRFCDPGRFLGPLSWPGPPAHSESPSLAAVRRPPSEISRRRRLPCWVGERVFGGAKKGRGLCLRRRIRRSRALPQGYYRVGLRRPSPQGRVSLGLFKISI